MKTPNEENTDSNLIHYRLFKPLLLKFFFSSSAFLVLSYLAISMYAAHSLSKPTRCFSLEKLSVFPNPPKNVKLRTSDGIEIAGWFISEKTKNQALIFVHGLNSSRTCELGGKLPELASAMNQKGFSILMIDLRGHGQSADARFTFGITERRDVVAAIDWLKTQGFQPKHIGVLGVSMGSASVIGSAAEHSEIGAVVTDSGYAQVYPIIQKHWKTASGLPEIFLPSTMLFGSLLTGHNLTASKPVQEINHISQSPILIIHSALDPYTPVINAYQLKKAAPWAEYWETQASEHASNYSANPQAYVNRVADFFHRSLK
jgi:dipeptidyl aminopeptidase/acylaminoacyl peptidase